MSRRLLVTAAAIAVMLGWASTGRAAILVNDTWLDGTRTDPAAPTYSEAGTDSDTDGNLESAWYRGGAGTFDPVGAGGPLRGAGYGGSSASWTTYFTAEGSEVNLTQPGHQLKVTWQFTTGDVNASNTSNNFRLALVDSPAVGRLGADGSPGSHAYTGYGMLNNMGETFDRAIPLQMYERTNPSGAILSAGAEWTAVGPGASSDGAVGFADNTAYTIEWTITRNAAANLDVVATITGGNINGTGSVAVTALNVAPDGGSYKFDTFSLRPSNEATTSTQFDTTLLRVEFIPEPASAGMMSLVGLAGLALRRRS
jgi:hypothetical protein